MTKQNEKIVKAMQTIQKNADPLFFLALVRGVCPHGLGMTSTYRNMCHDNNLCEKCWAVALEGKK